MLFFLVFILYLLYHYYGDIMNLRYYCEHILLRDLFTKDPIKIITKLVTERESFVYDLFLKTYESKHQAFPFMHKDFEVHVSSHEQLEFVEIDLPETFMEPTLCHKIILAYSMQLDLYQYFTLEDGFDPLFGKYKVLCSWIENSHIAFCNIKDDEGIEELKKKMYDIVMVN